MTLSPTNNLKGAAGAGTTGSNPNGVTAGGCFEANSSTSCSPPSVTDLTTLNPHHQEHFDPDFDVVDDMKFIDSLIRTIPEQQEHSSQQQQHHHHHHHHHHGAGGDLAHSYHANTSSNKR